MAKSTLPHVDTSVPKPSPDAPLTTSLSAPPEEDSETKKKKGPTLVVRLLSDYWDKEGVRHSASYTDENGVFRQTGALVELPEAEARKLVKTPAAERGDEY